MKRAMIAVAVVALSLPVLANASDYTASFKDGVYNGTIKSVSPEINNLAAKMTVKHEGNNVVGTVEYKDGKEIWTWNDMTINQKEMDLKTGAVAMEYGATAEKPVAGLEQKYLINCKDRAKNICDGDVDGRSNWVLKSAPNSITYLMFGVAKEKKGDAKEPVAQRHEFKFSLAK